jgi:murein DD-endopeptidase MepM/ murein hydrolase activator NlpD
MKKSLVVCVVLLAAAALYLPAIQELNQKETLEMIVDLEFRALQPGDIVKVVARGREDIRKAEVQFLGRAYPMGWEQNFGAWLTFLGLDLGIKPGSYPIDLSLLLNNGTTKHLRKEILVQEKKFPVTRLWVKQEYVTPPPEELERIRVEAELLAEVYNIFTPSWLGEGPFIIPSEGEAKPNFGERRIFNNEPRSPHSGVDISSPFGSPVRACNSGRVVLANDLYYAGKTVIIDHGLGVFTLYCHFSKIIAKRGKMVKKGDIIGEIGATGRVTGPHLHWGVRVSGSRIDPFSLLDLKF